ncbi:MAG: PHP domain-containing protein [Lachnospiraceae bacterium]|nr:PHP domain-containing protein [Lachnospiraceae bacterium]
MLTNKHYTYDNMYKNNVSSILIDLHTHSLSSGHGSTDTITDMAKSACQKGIQVLGISEHGPATFGSAKSSYFRSLKLAERRRCGITILYGAELNIININGDVDLEDEILTGLDYAFISIHPPALTPYEYADLTDTYIKAMSHPKVKFLGHIDDARFPVNFWKLLEYAKEHGIYPEINNGSLMPDAYRVSGQENCRKILDICKRIHLPVLLSSDSHGRKNVGNMEYIFPLLDEYNFPEELIINHRPDFLWKILDM